MFANCTHVIVSLLKACNVAVVGIECGDAPFNKKVHNRNCSFKEKSYKQNGGKLDYSRYCQVSLLTLSYHWQTLSNSFFIYFLSLKYGVRRA